MSSQMASSQLTSAQWTTLRKEILRDRKRRPPASVFGDVVRRGAVYRWGVAAACEAACEEEMEWLSRLAAGVKIEGKRFLGFDPRAASRRFQDSLHGKSCELSEIVSVLVWAASMPALLHHLDENEWWELLGAIQDFRDGLLQRDPTQPSVLVGVAELGLTLAGCLTALPSCRRLAASSLEALKKWCEQDDLAVSAVLSKPRQTRLALASVLRLRWLLGVVPAEVAAKKTAAKKQTAKDRRLFLKALDEIGIELTTWVAAMTRRDGAPAMSPLSGQELRDDNGPRGLLMSAARLDRESLLPAIKAALGKDRSKGRLVWQVSLPESMMHDEHAKLACMLPEWDVRRGRTVVEYGGREIRLELTAGKSPVLSGNWESRLAIDGQTRDPVDDWVATCEYSDDDMHYLELEQPYQGGYVMQRQIMTVREDRCFFFADAVVQGQIGTRANHGNAGTNGGGASVENPAAIEYQIRIPLANRISDEPEPRTRELFLGDVRPQAMALPLSAGEWKDSPSRTHLNVTADRHLLLSSSGHGQLYVPLWIDLSRKRFRMNRTWRQLTVGYQLQRVPAAAAAAYRVQVGKSQWILYRSLAPSGPRTFLGKQLIADFYCARFDAKEESYEDLITVEDQPK
jgi:hypothetical protein